MEIGKEKPANPISAFQEKFNQIIDDYSKTSDAKTFEDKTRVLIGTSFSETGYLDKLDLKGKDANLEGTDTKTLISLFLNRYSRLNDGYEKFALNEKVMARNIALDFDLVFGYHKGEEINK